MSTSVPFPVAYPDLGAVIGRVQSRFIRAAAPADVFDSLLTDLLEFTRSGYGFIANVLDDPADGHRFLRLFVLTDISWNEVTREQFRLHRSGDRPIEFHNLDTLFGAAVTSSAPVIANEPANDPRRGGLPPGHPGMQNFLGVPLVHGGDLVGVVGLANRPDGYDQALVDFLGPLFASVAAIIGAVRMDEARRSAEKALRESEERLRATFEMAAVGIAHIAPSGHFLRVNQRLGEILGHGTEQLLRLRVQDVTWPEDLEDNRRYASRLLHGDKPTQSLERRYVQADGTVVWASYNAALVRDGAGSPDYFIAVVEDITARKQTEAALLAAQAAERANAAKTEFLSRMSHELRTPLNAVLGFSQLLQMDTADPLTREQKAKLQHIEDAGAHLLAMINDVLDLSRIESGGMVLTPQTVVLPALVEESLMLVANAARDAGITLQVEPPVPGRADRARADHLRLRQVLVNLLSNAIKYNRPRGSVTVRWSAAAHGDAVQLQVSDTGQGLSAEQQAHLYEPFNRLGAERSSIEGTGIGLVVTQRLVHLMGGSLDVASEPGVGSAFTVTLPGAAGADAAAAPGEGDPSEDESAPAQGPLRTVLYAEDNPMNVELVREVLRLRAQCRLVAARSGREAIALALRERPDLLLLDMHLGDMTGLQVMERLAQEPALAGVPCVALSADAMPAPIAAAQRAGLTAYLTKPLDVARFLRVVDEALTPRDPASAAT
ncbi:hybrid sensor histidine kinase/response regulator [Piscinibacter sp.]|uniref:hybrid sensor histidine kinase/response regulator n=1 Tax=Piscinibacter sp. TaxID=1903157 RepID=UPI002C3EB64B|nr:PAS domain S-box protein [Albitalea sp.]HUG22988.1 PAS domain S-box protein [Albitalea sp.]